MVTVELTEKDLELFTKFRKHRDALEVLLDSNVFNIKNGSATLHFNSEGTLSSIELKYITFKRVKSSYPQNGLRADKG